MQAQDAQSFQVESPSGVNPRVRGMLGSYSHRWTVCVVITSKCTYGLFSAALSLPTLILLLRIT